MLFLPDPTLLRKERNRRERLFRADTGVVGSRRIPGVPIAGGSGRPMSTSEPGTSSPRRPPEAPGASRRLLSLAEAALLLGVSVASVRRLIWQGRLPVVRLTRRIQVDLRDLERLIEQAKDRPNS